VDERNLDPERVGDLVDPVVSALGVVVGQQLRDGVSTDGARAVDHRGSVHTPVEPRGG
jgi:hypothetical protein